MVLERLFGPRSAEHGPWKMFFVGFLFTILAVFLSLWVFSQHADIVMVFFVLLACIPFAYSAIRREARKAGAAGNQITLLAEHRAVLYSFIFLFLGMIIAFVLSYLFLPENTANSLFSIQARAITSGELGTQGSFDSFLNLFFNNFRIVLFSILLSFIYGVGFVFILVWNASVVGAAIGNFIRTSMAQYALSHGFVSAGAYLSIVSLGFLRFLIHGIPEFLAYLVAGMAGGLISMYLLKFGFKKKTVAAALLDVADLVVLSALLLVVAALLEVYISPLIF